MSRFSGRVVVITGAGSGIGRALAQQLAAKGARLALSDVNPQGLKATYPLDTTPFVRLSIRDVVDGLILMLERSRIRITTLSP